MGYVESEPRRESAGSPPGICHPRCSLLSARLPLPVRIINLSLSRGRWNHGPGASFRFLGRGLWDGPVTVTTLGAPHVASCALLSTQLAVAQHKLAHRDNTRRRVSGAWLCRKARRLSLGDMTRPQPHITQRISSHLPSGLKWRQAP